ncbi:phosphatase PAP2 family protein [Saccharopolyspora cebuensis]|uniref:phosphatase PAP2 family protein n=1 Tax=Saccharopolyspora cebuensis TaxID=418759 RepID=UPI0031E9DA69
MNAAAPVPPNTRPGLGAGPRFPGVLGCLVALGLSFGFFVWTPVGQRVDGYWLGSLAEPGSFARELLGFSGDPVVLGALLVGVVLVAVVRGRFRDALSAAGVVVGTVVAARLLKVLLPRPEFDLVGATAHNSFPSGHVAAVAGLVVALLLVVPRGARWWCVAPGVVAVVLVAASTVLAGWHRPSDALGAVLVAGAVGRLAAGARSPL